MFVFIKVLLGEIDEEKESQTTLREVSLEEILEAQSKQQAEKEERVKTSESERTYRSLLRLKLFSTF